MFTAVVRTCQRVDHIDRPVIAYNSHQDVVELGARLLANEPVAKQSVCLIRPDRHHGLGRRVALSAGKVVPEQADHPGRQVAGRELVVAVLVDSELGADLLVQLDHRAGKSVDTRLVVPDGMSRQLPAEHWRQIRTVDDLQLVV